MSTYFIETIQNQRIDGVGELTENTNIIWLALHGYRQLVEYSKTYFHSPLAWAGSWPPDLEDESQKTLAQMSISSWFGTDLFIGKDKKKDGTYFFIQQQIRSTPRSQHL